VALLERSLPVSLARERMRVQLAKLSSRGGIESHPRNARRFVAYLDGSYGGPRRRPVRLWAAETRSARDL
jgi:hypothetical protein